MHRVLGISTDHCFCLHSKERVPFHILIEVAYLDEDIPKKANVSFGTEEESSYSSAVDRKNKNTTKSKK